MCKFHIKNFKGPILMNVKVIEKDLLNPLAEIDKIELELNQYPKRF